MAGENAQNQVEKKTQNVSRRYVKRVKLQRLLESLFPEVSDFAIQMRDDQWCFVAPRIVEDCTHPSKEASRWADEGASVKSHACKHLVARVFVMASLDGCFVKEVLEPVRLVDTYPDGAASRSLQFSTLEEMRGFFEDPDRDNYSCRFISICQRNSWRPLQVTRPMAQLLATKHRLASSFWDLTSCFYNRSLELEETFSSPFSLDRNGPWLEASYSIRYPELKKSDDEWVWVIRHSGVHQRHNTQTSQSVVVLLSPTPNSKAHQMALGHLNDNSSGVARNPFWIHTMLLAAYALSWRQYIASLEKDVLPMGNSAFSTYIEEPLRFGYNNLNSLVSLETRLMKAVTLLESTKDAVNELAAIYPECYSLPSNQNLAVHMETQLQNYLRQCTAFCRTATFVRQRAQTTAQLLSDTLSFRDQIIAKEQNGNMIRLTKSAVFVTILTLFYVPASYVATFFGMNFFSMDEERSRIVGTSMVWIYIVSTATLSTITLLFYYWLLHRSSGLFQRLAPKVLVSTDWKTMTRRWTGMNNNLELSNTAA